MLANVCKYFCISNQPHTTQGSASHTSWSKNVAVCFFTNVLFSFNDIYNAVTRINFVRKMYHFALNLFTRTLPGKRKYRHTVLQNVGQKRAAYISRNCFDPLPVWGSDYNWESGFTRGFTENHIQNNYLLNYRIPSSKYVALDQRTMLGVYNYIKNSFLLLKFKVVFVQIAKIC